MNDGSPLPGTMVTRPQAPVTATALRWMHPSRRTARSADVVRASGKRFAVLLAAALTSLSGQETEAADHPVQGGPVSLPAYTITDTPLADTAGANSFAGASWVLGVRQLEEMGAMDIASALRRLPGVTISRFNHIGAFGGGEGGAIMLRGLGASRPGGEIKTFIDGVPAINGVFNHPLLDLISIDAAAEIDVHSRAMPLDFGNTFAAINVVTPRLQTPGRMGRATLAAGSFDTFVERLDFATRNGAYDLYVNQSVRQSDGHRPDSDGRMQNYLVKLGATLSPSWQTSYLVNHTRNHATDPGMTGSSGGAPSTRGERYLTSSWLHVLSVTHDHDTAQGFVRAYVNDGNADWHRRQFSGNADSLNSWRLYGVRFRESLKPWAGGELVAGADLDYDSGETRTVPANATAGAYGPVTMRLLSPYVGASQTFSPVSAIAITPSAGARHYAHDVFEATWAPQAGLVVRAGKTQLHASASRAINYPGVEVAVFSNLLIPALGQSWRRLNPEQADQFETGIRHEFNARTAVAVTVFRNRVRERYVIVFPPPPPPRYSNLESYRTEGVEIAADAALGRKLAVFGAASFLRSSPDHIPYAPESTLTAGLNWQLAERWKLGADAVYVSSMHQASAARIAGRPKPGVIGSQFFLNARLTHRIPVERWPVRPEAFVSAENLTNRNFAYQPGYPVPGISFLAGVRLSL